MSLSIISLCDFISCLWPKFDLKMQFCIYYCEFELCMHLCFKIFIIIIGQEIKLNLWICSVFLHFSHVSFAITLHLSICLSVLYLFINFTFWLYPLKLLEQIEPYFKKTKQNVMEVSLVRMPIIPPFGLWSMVKVIYRSWLHTTQHSIIIYASAYILDIGFYDNELQFLLWVKSQAHIKVTIARTHCLI